MRSHKNSLIQLSAFKDERGGLVAIEGSNDVPFNIARVYYIFENVNGEPRGFHAHKDLQQLMICVSGSCEVHLDDGRSKTIYCLDSPEQGVLIVTPTWREMNNFSKDCVLIVLASDVYKSSDYIHDYEEFSEAYGKQ
jgi:dTDP-4-dehydrorhamnose 3,5-epimerase-like enzyme